MRGAMAVVILYLFSVQFALFASRAAGGGLFAATVVICCYWFLTLVGGIHFSTAIAEEKEEQTLALLKMTGASSFSILAGKSIPRLAMAILFLGVISPFLIMALMLGGVLPLGLLSGILGICCYTVMLSQMGLFASVVCRSAPRAFLTTSVLWVLFELCHWWFDFAITVTTPSPGGQLSWFGEVLRSSLNWVPNTSLIMNLSDDLLTFATSEALDSDAWLPVRLWNLLREVWHFHMTFHLVAATVFFVISWILFEPCTSRAAGEGAAAVPRDVAVAVSRPRPWNAAVVWKSWQYVSGGVLWFVLRAVGGTVLVGGFLGVLHVFDYISSGAAVTGLMVSCGLLFFVINLARLFGRVLNEEIHGQTLPALVMLPRQTSRTLWAMIAGLLPAVAAGAGCTVTGYCLHLLMDPNAFVDLNDLLELVVEPWFWHVIVWNVLTLHLGLLLTTYVRYGGMIIGYVLLWLFAPIC